MTVLERNGVLPKRTKGSLHKFIQHVPGWQATARTQHGIAALAESMVCQAPRLGDTEGLQPVTWLQRWWTANIRNYLVWLSVGDDKRQLSTGAELTPLPTSFWGLPQPGRQPINHVRSPEAKIQPHLVVRVSIAMIKPRSKSNWGGGWGRS